MKNKKTHTACKPLVLNKFCDLLRSVQKIGIGNLSMTEDKKFETEGLDVNISDIFSSDKGELFVVLGDGSINKAVIHIVDISSWQEEWGYPRFHIHECEKIQEMKEHGKNYRYRASSRKDGTFYIMKEDKKWKETLEICSYCLTKYNIRFNSKETKQTFPLKKYIQSSMKHSRFVDIPLDYCTIPNTYTKDWPKISGKVKERENYICSLCRRDFSSPECKEFLDTHHINADRRDNTKENLQVLCIECHAEQHNHNRIKETERYKKYLRSDCPEKQAKEWKR